MRQVTLKRSGDLIYQDPHEDITVDEDIVLALLGANFQIEQGATLRSFFRMFERYPVLARLDPWISHLIDDISKLPDIGCRKSFDLLTLGRSIEAASKSKTPKMKFGERDKESGFVKAHFEYIDKPYRNLQHYICLSGKKADDEENYSLSMTPLREILDVPLDVGGCRIILSQDEDTFLDHFNDVFTLHEVIDGIIHEVTFFGTDEQKDEQAEELTRIAEKVDKQIERKKSMERFTVIDGGKSDD